MCIFSSLYLYSTYHVMHIYTVHCTMSANGVWQYLNMPQLELVLATEKTGVCRVMCTSRKANNDHHVKSYRSIASLSTNK